MVAVDSDDTTSMLFRMKAGMSGYLGTMTATGPGFSFQVFGSKGWVRLEGMTHVAGASSEERRTTLFGTLQIPASQGSRGDVGGGEAGRDARLARGVCRRCTGRPGVSRFRSTRWSTAPL